MDVPIEMPSRVTLETDVDPADWIHERLARGGGGGTTVGQIVPTGFEAYARVFHPATGEGGVRIRWRELAERHGTTVHPQMQFTHVVGTRDTDNLGSTVKPNYGCLPREEAAWLADMLARYTETPTTCWFAVWEGYGLSFPRSAAIRGMSDTYLLFRGPVEAASHLEFHGWFQSANLWWPDDRAWCVATDIDGDSTYVGGSEACIDAILADERLEALTASVDDRFDAWGDDINPRPPRMPPHWGMPG